MTKANNDTRVSLRKLDKLPDRTRANPLEGPSLCAKFWKKAKLVRPKAPGAGSTT